MPTESRTAQIQRRNREMVLQALHMQRSRPAGPKVEPPPTEEATQEISGPEIEALRADCLQRHIHTEDGTAC